MYVSVYVSTRLHLHRQFAPVHMMLTKVKLWPGHMCTKFQINRSTIDDFRNSEKCQLSLTSRDEKTENILQPTRSLYDVWLKSYGSLCVFHVWGDLDLDLPPFKVIFYVWGQHIPISVNKQILNIFCVWVFVIWLYLKKQMYRPCDLDLWPMKVNYFFVNWLSGY